MDVMDRVIQLSDSEILFLRKGKSFLLAGKAGRRFPLCILTADEEYFQTLEEDDIIAVSAPEGGSLRAAAMLMELVRTDHLPLVVLPRNHPGSKRLKYVVSAGSEIFLDCSIRRGTHPEQHLLCSSEELGGIMLAGIPGAVRITDLAEGVRIEITSSREIISFP
jgi:hypothetical protein